MSRSDARALPRSAVLLMLVGAPLIRHVVLGQQPSTPSQSAAPTAVASSISSRTAGYEKRDGFMPIYLDQRQGKILLEIPHDSMRALLLVSQATGLGSNPIGIDRGSDGEARVVRFDKSGERVLVVFELGVPQLRSCQRGASTERARGISAEHRGSPAVGGRGGRAAAGGRD